MDFLNAVINGIKSKPCRSAVVVIIVFAISINDSRFLI